MTFNIGNQSGGIFNNVAGNQNIYGGQQMHTGPADQALSELRAALARQPLSPTQATAARAAVDEIEAAVSAGPEPDRARGARALERLTRMLASAGSLAAAGASLVGPLRWLATWLGPAAAHVSMMLPR
ncbi:hypothetical protein [Actinoplanes subtropicus]|uniref:hypothetical protein n=1 Tax=Actinoplanes subtropicus TaxID=543632 RepID=UPI0004C32743|nr:hypothetical protein [Actinoplanes subtropicus]